MMDYYIHKEDVSNYPLIVFDGVIHVVETKKDVIKYCKIIAQSDVVGFDTDSVCGLSDIKLLLFFI